MEAEKTNNKTRIQYVDAIKGLAIIWIIFYHLMPTVGFKISVLNPLMELFLVLFFVFSGYFYRPNKASIWQNIKKRGKSLLVPFFLYSIFFWVVGTIYLLATNQAPFIETLGCLRNFFAGCIWNRDIQNWFNWDYYRLGKRYFFLADFWFLIALLFASIIFFLIIDRMLKKTSITIITILVLFALTGICLGFKFTLPYNLHIVPYWTAFMILGALIGNKKLIELPALGRTPKYCISILLLFFAVALALMKTPALNQYRGSFDGDNQVISMLLCISAAIPFTFGIGMLFQQLEADNLRVNEIAYVGSHSLIFYLFHMFYAWLISIIFNFSLLEVNKWWVGLLLAISIIVICIIHSISKDYINKRISLYKQNKTKANI